MMSSSPPFYQNQGRFNRKEEVTGFQGNIATAVKDAKRRNVAGCAQAGLEHGGVATGMGGTRTLSSSLTDMIIIRGGGYALLRNPFL
jgi:hypothetical protein